MAHYIAIIEDEGPDHAVGVWFPDLPGCFSGGDDIDEAMENAPEALELYAQDLIEDGRQLPRPRTLTELKADPEVAGDLRNYMVALIELPTHAHAAE
ncbi:MULTISPECIES: type II toxin-antitoxin system HicB family antitoxin [unclassified Bradyrhizobium]|uniref:type II toxin-antitoxin system HicB family antitoxin n=1 Tax=unclassified Bradyrhizobium TaxID=2631580 RepID=UPI00188D9E75|nr:MULTISPECIES: type II toxin-antitoxin system HicB family antitoxin [unclassified Bradyrhizobium]MDN4985171.1 type II toxin-antitoxin system HicB family antitoxin [Bradyrhizobium sp. WYCCWR 13022]QOZ51337.1 HicB family protein [Bradyrhizobium sp. CCBAU 53338]